MKSFAAGVLLTFVVLLGPLFSEAKKVQRKPTQTEARPIQIKVIYGDRISLFSIAKTGSKGQVEFSNNAGAKSAREISVKDYNYLRDKILKISGSPNEKSFCYRNSITITIDQKELLGCIGAPNKFARDVQEITNLVSILF